MSDHVWAQENIAAYVAGGLEPAEAERLQTHLADCPDCTAAVQGAQALEHRLASVLRRANPGPALEDRILRALPSTPPRQPLRFSRQRKLLLAAAAVLLMGAFGAGVSALMEQENLRLPSERAVTRNNLKQMGVRLYGGSPTPVDDSSSMIVTETEGSEHGSKTFTDGTGNETVFSTRYKDKASDPAVQLNVKTAEQLAKEFREDVLTKDLDKAKTPIATMVAPTATPPPNVPPGGFGRDMLGRPSGPVTGGGMGGMGGGGMGMGGGGFAGGGYIPGLPAPTNMAVGKKPAPDTKGEAKGKQDSEGKESRMVFSYTAKGPLPELKTNFFQPNKKTSSTEINDLVTKDKGKDVDKDDGKKGNDPKAEKAPGDQVKDKEDEGQQKSAQKPPEAQPEPPAPRKIIIRTGDLEFEIDSFDASVATIMKLVTAAKGGFVATINSEKLPNGKVRGSVVVRIPPDLLDAFVLDLRKELGKTGELKNQRIGSTDITKQYTDLESRLRAARTMEERLLLIIKDGKGQIKDLLQAEKELGVWRTQIEEIQGELRYYGNLASLSTLTIKLHEKNIQTAVSISESERVQAGIEVEDVEKAHQQALKAILDAKGRITRSELKQHAAGQFNAVLHFEVAPDATGPLRDVLRQLGNMVRLQIDRLQHTEGGGTPPKDGKIQRGNTQFEVSIYNLANVAPRETVILRLAAHDVPGDYQKLREAVVKAKGHVRNAQIDEQDRQSIHAQVDFDIRRLSEGEILTHLAGIGETLSRQANRVPESENVTDSKVLYRVTLVDADSIQPRETATIKIAAIDVPAAYQKLRDALAKAKARVVNAQLNEQDRRNITANLDFTFRRTEEANLQAALTGAGEVLSRHVTRLPESATVTDAKVLARVELFQADTLPPRDTVTLKIAAVDVPAVYEALRTAITKAKGRINQAQLNEQDRHNITAQLAFDVPRGQETAVREALEAAGEALTRQVVRQQDNISVTDTKVGFAVDLIPAAAIPPRETTTLALEVSKVADILTLFNAEVKEAQGRIVETQVGQERSGQVTARVVFDVPLAQASGLVEKFRAAGQVRVHQVNRDPQAPEGKLALARISVTLSNTPLLVPSDQGLWSQLRGGLAFSLRGLSISASWLIVGLLFVLPWALLLWAIVWLARRLWRPEPLPVAALGEVAPKT